MRIIPLLLFVILTISCAASSIAPDRMRNIAGTWRTGQDMIVVIGPGGETGYTATVEIATGFQVGSMGVDGVVIRDIRSQADGTFTGTFLVPDAEPMKVRIALMPPDRLMIVTRDSRMRGGTMIWYREPNR